MPVRTAGHRTASSHRHTVWANSCGQSARHRSQRAASCCVLSGRWLSVVCCSNRYVNLASWAERKGVAQGLNTGNALVVRQRLSVTITPRSTSRGGRNPPPPSAQLGPPSSVEPTVRPGLAGLVAVKRGREPATQPANNPEMGCESRDQ